MLPPLYLSLIQGRWQQPRLPITTATTMQKHTDTPHKIKAAKPDRGSPLLPRATGRWAKMVRSRLRCFGNTAEVSLDAPVIERRSIFIEESSSYDKSCLP